MAFDYAAIARKQYEYFNEHDIGKIQDLATDETRAIYVALGRTFHGRKGLGDYVRGWITGFPDAKIEVKKVIASGENVAVEFVGRGTHTGTLRLPIGAIGPTGRKLSIECVELMTFSEGKIVETKLYFDAATLLTDLGLFRPETIPAAEEQPSAPI